ncbi:hypothetical protein SERLADRAFT_448396 [Serpula lacrymans var. lacrymans S7.9]|uniref:Uncharacterized protein n=1 Tax=Serpula lacrymans var. lacrymans (strain S7.9) TaxID=578457 RepID=F8NSU2_SERL9|nr:uncharacterized protein SERLADRAFT_448396 [Serpula lacrymans var. lacrymans S7.9]EGO25415.1 hypothetical protein SERLADRAFT_448396 [Serpula lacrymans var. lacrymans S7.9]
MSRNRQRCDSSTMSSRNLTVNNQNIDYDISGESTEMWGYGPRISEALGKRGRRGSNRAYVGGETAERLFHAISSSIDALGN